MKKSDELTNEQIETLKDLSDLHGAIFDLKIIYHAFADCTNPECEHEQEF